MVKTGLSRFLANKLISNEVYLRLHSVIVSERKKKAVRAMSKVCCKQRVMQIVFHQEVRSNYSERDIAITSE